VCVEACRAQEGERGRERPHSTNSKKAPTNTPYHHHTHTPQHSWAYIKTKDLQNPGNKREILCDDALKAVFEGKDKVTMFEMNKLLTPHLSKP
jgi:hypothetical protein